LIAGIALIFVGQTRMAFITAENFEIPHSMGIRFWAWYEKYTGMDLMDHLFGKGLGYSGKVIDGMIARTFFDFGLLGLILYSVYYYRFLRDYKIIGLIILLYSVSLDVFSSSKIMFSLFLTIYYFRMIKNNHYSMLYK
jgi:hypothetical protein